MVVKYKNKEVDFHKEFHRIFSNPENEFILEALRETQLNCKIDIANTNNNYFLQGQFDIVNKLWNFAQIHPEEKKERLKQRKEKRNV